MQAENKKQYQAVALPKILAQTTFKIYKLVKEKPLTLMEGSVTNTTI